MVLVKLSFDHLTVSSSVQYVNEVPSYITSATIDQLTEFNTVLTAYT